MSQGTMKIADNMVILKGKFASDVEIITELFKRAKENALVSDLFLEKILERELQYPTGLKMQISFAMPHISDGCLNPFVTIATLESPVDFLSMDRSGEKVPVSIVLLFGVLDMKNQVKVLQSFAKLFQDQNFMQSLIESNSEMEVINKLKEKLGDLIEKI